VIEAFLATFQLRRGAPPEGRDDYYMGNLPNDCFPPDYLERDFRKHATMHEVRQTLTEVLRRLNNPHGDWRPHFASRNLVVFLEDEKIVSNEALNDALYPYWRSLWRLAARGHYSVKREPIREKFTQGEYVHPGPIPSVHEGPYTLSFARGEGNDLDILLSFPGPRGPMYPIGPYPKISEFRTMLKSLSPEDWPFRHWQGEYFYGYTAEREGKTEFWFRATRNGITFGFSEEEWKSLQELFRRAWTMPEVQVAWDGLILEYGEL